MVLLSPAQRCLRHLSPDRSRPLLLPSARVVAGRYAQSAVDPASQGQVRQQVERFAEIEYRGALGWLIGEEGRGIKAALAMTHLTRLDFAIGSAGLMRRALSEGIHHTAGRRAFQR